MNEDVLGLLKEKYFLNDEKEWVDLAKRVSGIYPPIEKAIINMEYIPSTPTLLNGNTGDRRKGTLSSCFPMGIEDSLEGIYEANKEAALVTKASGGVGYNFSVLRSSNEIIKSINRPSTGPMVFGRVFNETLEAIQQGGVRRGAGMLQLSSSHPQILEFIRAKKDLSQFRRFNFSVRFPNSFYEKLIQSPDEVHMVRNVIDEKEYPLIDYETGKEITVKQLWDEVIYLAWLNGEPGIFNEDIAFNQCTVTNLNKEVLANPCLTGDTLIAVADGRISVPISQLAEEKEDVPVFTLNQKGELEVKPFINVRKTRTNAGVFKVTFDSGLTVTCTGDHKFLTDKGYLVKIIDLCPGDMIVNYVMNIFPSLFKDKKTYKDIDESYWYKMRNVDQLNASYKYNILNNDIEFDINRKCENCGKEFSVNYNNRQITFCSSTCLEISCYNQKFEIENLKTYYDRILTIELTGREDVYDGTVEDNHTVFVGGHKDFKENGVSFVRYVITGQCNEFISIPYSSCNLGSINLSKLITSGGNFDEGKFKSLIEHSTRMLNECIDVNDYPLEKIKKTTMKIRPMGLGAMGLAHLFYKLRIPYGSDESVEWTKRIMRALTLHSMYISSVMAKEKGCSYPAYNQKLFFKANERFFNEVFQVFERTNFEIKEHIEKYGIWNSCFTSIAPNGSIGYMAETTGAIEPQFSLSYIRKIEEKDGSFREVRVTDEIFKEYLENQFTEKGIKEIYEYLDKHKGSIQGCDLMPEEDQKVFVVASDLTPNQHLNILETVAKNVSLSVSKCVSKNTLIKTEKGYNYIKNLSINREEDTFSDLNINILNRYKEKEKAISFYYNGIRKCKKITLSNGIVFTGTINHKILSKNNWIELQHLNIDDVIDF